MTTLRRRSFIRHAAQLVAVAAVAPQLIPLARAADSCADPASEALRISMSYVPVAADPAQSCVSCAFFTTAGDQPACGDCQIMSGPVDAAAYCDSWSPKG